MGIFSILLGIITFAGFTCGGVIVANKVIDTKVALSASITDLGNVSNTPIVIAIIVVFGFIGLLIGMSLIMHGLTLRRGKRGSASVGTVSALLGVIALCVFVLAGWFIADFVVKYRSILAMADAFAFLNNVTELVIFEIVIAFFTFIGLLVCTNMVMHCLVYKKVARLQNANKPKG